MAKIFDKLLLFIYSLAIGIFSIVVILVGFRMFQKNVLEDQLANLFSDSTRVLNYSLIIGGAVVFLISIRFFYVSMRKANPRVQTIDQRTDYGDIQISLDTIENLSLQAANSIRGIQDLKTRVKVSNAGLEIVIRTFVDGNNSIPELTEEVQRIVKDQVETISGIPVAAVSVFVANVQQSNVVKTRRVE